MVNSELIQILYLLSEKCNTKWERNCSCIRKTLNNVALVVEIEFWNLNHGSTAITCEKHYFGPYWKQLGAQEQLYHVVRRYKEVKGEEFQGSEQSHITRGKTYKIARSF